MLFSFSLSFSPSLLYASEYMASILRLPSSRFRFECMEPLNEFKFEFEFKFESAGASCYVVSCHTINHYLIIRKLNEH